MSSRFFKTPVLRNPGFAKPRFCGTPILQNPIFGGIYGVRRISSVSAGVLRKLIGAYPRLFSVGAVARGGLLLRSSAKPLLEGDCRNIRRGRAVRQRSPSGFSAHSPYRAWDVISSCEIEGSADSSISRAAANDIGVILERADIKAVFTNGAAAHRLYRKLIFPEYAVEDVPLPSTSPANARISEAQLTARWMCVRDAIMGI